MSVLGQTIVRWLCRHPVRWWEHHEQIKPDGEYACEKCEACGKVTNRAYKRCPCWRWPCTAPNCRTSQGAD